MYRKQRVMISAAAAAVIGSLALLGSSLWISWRESLTSEETYAGGLAAALGNSAERMIVDTREMLAQLKDPGLTVCTPEHLRTMQDAGVSKPYVRAIGYWNANERVCGVGFVLEDGIRPARADRIYDSGLIAWWPSAQTEIGGTRMFLMRYGDHDAAIDPRLLLELGPAQERKAALWVEHLRMISVPVDAALPSPESLPLGVSLDKVHGRVLSRFSQNSILPIDVVASEPLNSVVARHAQSLVIGTALGLLMVGLWCYLVVRFSRYELSMEHLLRKALAAGEIHVHYQPVMDMVTGACIGAEALARWELDGREPISPAVFIPVAEKTGLIHEVTATVLTQAVQDMRKFLLEHPGASINVNLSPEDLRSERIADVLNSCLEQAALPASAVKLEITERALVNTETSRALIRELRRRGHQIAIDDFGTGYSSLSYLESFEVDILKIDKAFIDAIGTQAATSEVIIHVIKMAEALGLETVAEGVTDLTHVVWLIEHGVELGQGFLFSKPLSPGEFYEFFESHRTLDLVAA